MYICKVEVVISYYYVVWSPSQWPRGLRRRCIAARLLRLWVRIPLKTWMLFWCECCVLSGRGLCDALITVRRVLATVMRHCVWARNLKSEEAMVRFGPQRHKKKKVCSVTMPQRRGRTRTNEENVKAKDRKKNIRRYRRKLLIEGLEHFYIPWNIIRLTKSRTLKGAGYVARQTQRRIWKKKKIWHVSLRYSEMNTSAAARCCVCISSANDRIHGVFWGLLLRFGIR